jgi:hypothetical protein
MATALAIGLGVLGVSLPVRDRTVGWPQERLDEIMPRYQFHHRYSIEVAAAPFEVDRAIRVVTADEIRYYNTLTWIRRLGRRGPESLLNPSRGTPILDLATRTGFRLLVDEPGREIVLGVSAPVSPAARAATLVDASRPLSAAAEGYASIAMNFHIAPNEDGRSVLSTETRVFAPDAETRRRFATYWRVIYPGSTLIRRGWLAAIRRRAESGT